MRISDWSSDVCSSDLELLYEIADLCGSLRPGLRRRRNEKPAELVLTKLQDGLADLELVMPLAALLRRHLGGHAAVLVEIDGIVGHHLMLSPRRAPARSEERRVRKECVSTCRSRGWP